MVNVPVIHPDRNTIMTSYVEVQSASARGSESATPTFDSRWHPMSINSNQTPPKSVSHSPSPQTFRYSPDYSISTATNSQEDIKTEPKSTRRKCIWCVAFLILLIVLVVGFIVGWFSSHANDEQYQTYSSSELFQEQLPSQPCSSDGICCIHGSFIMRPFDEAALFWMQKVNSAFPPVIAADLDECIQKCASLPSCFATIYKSAEKICLVQDTSEISAYACPSTLGDVQRVECPRNTYSSICSVYHKQCVCSAYSPVDTIQTNTYTLNELAVALVCQKSSTSIDAFLDLKCRI